MYSVASTISLNGPLSRLVSKQIKCSIVIQWQQNGKVQGWWILFMGTVICAMSSGGIKCSLATIQEYEKGAHSWMLTELLNVWIHVVAAFCSYPC